VVAGADRLADDGGAFGEQSAEEDARFDLRAGYRQRVIDRVQRSPVDDERRKLAVFAFDTARLDAGAHLFERFDDAAHRSSREGFVAEDAAGEGLRGQQSRHHANRRPRIAGVQIPVRLLPAIESAALYGDRGAFFRHFNSERADAAEGRMAIGAGRIIGDF
jgi:hypothetical protein